MPTILTHPAVLIALAPRFRPSVMLLCLGGFCSILPDVDVTAFAYGIPYAHMFGHRGFSHSIVFALLTAAVFSFTLIKKSPHYESRKNQIFLFLFFCTMSHGCFDAMTNGGLGVAFFSPFSNRRFFFPWQPLNVSPVGIDFFSPRALQVLRSEIIYVWAPMIFLHFAFAFLIPAKMKQAHMKTKIASPKELNQLITNLITRLTAAGYDASPLERVQQTAFTTGSEWFGELGLALRKIESQKVNEQELKASIRKLLRAVQRI